MKKFSFIVGFLRSNSINIACVLLIILLFNSCKGENEPFATTITIENRNEEPSPQGTIPAEEDSVLEVRLIIDGFGSFPNSIRLVDSIFHVRILTDQKSATINLQASDYSNPKFRLIQEGLYEYLMTGITAGGEIQFVISYKGLNSEEDYTIMHKVKVLTE